MDVYLRAKLDVSSIILTGFRQGGVEEGGGVIIPPTSKWTPKKPTQIRVNKLKPVIKNEAEVVLRLSLNIIGGNETNFPHKLLLNNRQVTNLRKALHNKY